jgi:hypothetical protein
VEEAGSDRCRPRRGRQELRGHELAQAHRTIAELEAELEAVKAAVALFKWRGASQPKRRCQVAEGLSNLGYPERVACRIAGVSRSCFYEYKYHVPSDRQIRWLILSGL